MMKALLSTVICILSFQVYDSAVVQKTMDQAIMEAAESHTMFDLMHMMAGEPMVMVELDLLLSLPELAQYKLRGANRRKRKATSNNRQLWENCSVSYELTNNDFSPKDIRIIRQAINEWQNFTCLEFTEVQPDPNSQRDRITFRNGGGCYSRLGRTGGSQPIALAPGCRTKGIVVHEIGHAIGWIHEQARPDRDDFITINFDQIPPNWRSQFAKVRSDLIDDRNVIYDYESIMHYSGNVFGPRTIETKDPAAQNRLGQRIGLSFRDIKLANLMYECAQRMDCQPRTCPGAGFMRKDCKCVCPGPGLNNPLVPCDGQPVTTRPPVRTTPAPATTTTPTSPDCIDLRNDCEALNRNNRSCINDPARMSIFCRKTCDLCNTEPACMDYDEACPFFANNGYCERDGASEFFQQECPLSCGVCEPVDRCQALLDRMSSSPRHGLSIMATFAMVIAVLLI